MDEATSPEIQEVKNERPPCTICGESMEGEHHKAKAHKACREAPAEVPEAVAEPAPISSVVKVIPDLKPIEETHHARHTYWLGTADTCPVQNVTVGGITFPRAMGELIDKDGGGQPTFTGGRGDMVELTDDQVERIQKAVARKVLRWVGSGANRRPMKLDMDSPYYIQQKADEPLGRYLYMLRTDDLPFDARRTGTPEPMVD